MKHQKTTGIILARTDYGEADRILTVLTPDRGKLRLMARGVRKIKSKLAGGIELFSTSHVTYIEGKGELGTLISTRLIRHYGRIVDNLERVQLGYDLIRLLNRATEDHPEAEYYQLLEQTFAALDSPDLDLELIRAWFLAQMLRLSGHTPNLTTDSDNQPLSTDASYQFDLEAMCFNPAPGRARGKYTADHIKVLRLLFGNHAPVNLAKVQGMAELLPDVVPFIRSIAQSQLPAQLTF